jgi:hypothetical protein
MISIHRIAALSAKISKAEDSHWLELVITPVSEDTPPTRITLYFQTRNSGFTEERRFTLALAEAINSIPPMNIGSWGSDEASDPELSPREQAAEAGF